MWLSIFFQHHLLKRLFFPHRVFLPPLSKIIWVHVQGFKSAPLILFHWSVCLFLCQYHTGFFFVFFFRLFFLNYLFYFIFWLCWVFISVQGLSLVVASGGHSSSRCAGLSLSRPLLLWSTGSRRPGSVVVAHGLSCSTACGIFPDQGTNPCPLHWQADSQPLCHQGSPIILFWLL